ncbi:MAG TPA: hypothetical protein VEP90_27430 [Methylomirabilota bacterium]|nr:hypothetical protein [Methylomirabilota bacterium]
MQRRDGHGHGIEECIKEGVDVVRAEVKDMQEQVQFEKFSCCCYCHVPQAICQRWEPREEEGRWQQAPGGHCQFKGIIIPIIASALKIEEQWVIGVMYKIVQEDGIDTQSDNVIYKWLGRRVE